MTRRAREIDVTEYSELVGAAIAAFSTDVSYIISMTRSAVTIENKRDTWRKRAETCSE